MKKIIIGLLLLTCFVTLNSCKKKIFGCTDPASVNYKSDATDDDGTCTYLTIGQNYEGGVIFHLDATKKHGLICAATNQSNGLIWGSTTTTTLATGTAIGTGQTNTNAIVVAQGPGNYAAYLCDTLVLNGYRDWYLPSRKELYLLYSQKEAGIVSGFANAYYWSSTEYNTFYAWNVSLGTGDEAFDGSTYFKGKAYSLYVRAIRAF